MKIKIIEQRASEPIAIYSADIAPRIGERILVHEDQNTCRVVNVTHTVKHESGSQDWVLRDTEIEVINLIDPSTLAA
jgi:hypothetical protein